MGFTVWYVIIGLLLIGMALSGSVLKRLPISTSMLYLAIGIALGPVGAGLLRIDPLAAPVFVERFAEVAVLASLFTAGLKLRVPLDDPLWRVPLRLGVVTMAVNVGLVALVGRFGLGLPLGAAILLGAILAPTDPVLASEVQVDEPSDRDPLRFALTGEAGLNDGTAFPFAMLGLGLLGIHELGDMGWRWAVLDVLWAVPSGLAIGSVLGLVVARLVLYLRQTHREAVGLDDFLALGLICLSYGVALLAHATGFLAVFAAGLALRRVERQSRGDKPLENVKDEALATHPEKAPAYMAEAVLSFNEQVERLLEVGLVLLLGGMLTRVRPPLEALWFVPLLALVIRPVSVIVGLAGSGVSVFRQSLIAWFGIRGIGSLYYLMYAVDHGLPGDLARRLTDLTLIVVAVSVVMHGISATPLMARYRRWTERKHEKHKVLVTAVRAD